MLALSLPQASRPCCDFSFLVYAYIRIHLSRMQCGRLAVTQTLQQRDMINGCDLSTQRSTLAPAGVGNTAAVFPSLLLVLQRRVFVRSPASFAMWRPGFASSLKVCLSCWPASVVHFLSVCLLCSGCMLVVGALWNCLTNRKARWHILQGLSANWDLRVSNNVQGGFLAMASRRESLRGEKCGSTDPVPFMVDRRGYLCFKGNDG